MSHTKLLGPAARFGSRYGKKIRELVAETEKKYKNKRLKCPFCNDISVKRLSYGIWYCTHCGKKFTGKAYNIQ
ncbi:MAG: 50S ribosomal protein L37ae [Candidatus Nanopusillus sp.]|jgi:large subunit ribosomal protein L37Ae|nr:50S ribosomal protein L37ae [Candidatus Nanopusillus sp.]